MTEIEKLFDRPLTEAERFDYHRWTCFCAIWHVISMTEWLKPFAPGAPSVIWGIPWTWDRERGFTVGDLPKSSDLTWSTRPIYATGKP